MDIGRNAAISNSPNLGNLPSAINALYELSRLDPSDIEDGIESGAITPDMKIKDDTPTGKNFNLWKPVENNLSNRARSPNHLTTKQYSCR